MHLIDNVKHFEPGEDLTGLLKGERFIVDTGDGKATVRTYTGGGYSSHHTGPLSIEVARKFAGGGSTQSITPIGSSQIHVKAKKAVKAWNVHKDEEFVVEQDPKTKAITLDGEVMYKSLRGLSRNYNILNKGGNVVAHSLESIVATLQERGEDDLVASVEAISALTKSKHPQYKFVYTFSDYHTHSRQDGWTQNARDFIRRINKQPGVKASLGPSPYSGHDRLTIYAIDAATKTKVSKELKDSLHHDQTLKEILQSWWKAIG